MAIDLPTLSSAGFVSDPAVKLERLVSYFFITDYSQSNQHHGRVASLPYLIKAHGTNPDILVDRIQVALENMLSSYFDAVNVEVREEDPLLSNPVYNIVLEGTVTQDGKRYDISKLLNISHNTLNKVSELQIK